LDGKPAEITPSAPPGFISLPLTAGEHRLELRFGSTPPRAVGTVLSLLSLLALARVIVSEIIEGRKP